MKTLVIVVVWLGWVFSGIAGLNDGLVAHYPFEGNANDVSGNVNNGTAHGGLSYIAGAVGQGILLDGADDYVNVPDSDSLDLQTGSGTISAFIKADVSQPWAANGAGIVTKESSSSFSTTIAYEYAVRWIQGMYVSHGASGTYVSGGADMRDGKWHHIAATWSGAGGSVRLFSDGILVAETNQTSGIINNTADPVRIGVFRWNVSGLERFFKGMIDEVRIYNRALSLLEVRELASGSTFAMIWPAVEIGWSSSLGTNYQVQWCTNLLMNNWYNLGEPIPGNGTTNFLFDSTRTNERRFYRVFPFNPSQGLVAYYPFDGNADDASGNGNNGGVYGAVSAPDRKGFSNRALSFDGDNDYVSAGNLDLGNRFSLSVWVKLTKPFTDVATIFSGNPGYPMDDAVLNELVVSPYHGYDELVHCGGRTFVWTGYTFGTNWCHVALVYDNGPTKVYVDGRMVGENTLPATNGQLRTIGSWMPDDPDIGDREPWKGQIDEVRVYNRALSALEVSALGQH